MKKLIAFLVLLLKLFCGCNNSNHICKLYLPAEVEKIVSKLSGKGSAFIYYHPGNCSICYGTILLISEEFPDIPFISVNLSKDTALVNHYLENIKFSGIAFNDNDSVFLKNNINLLMNNSLFLTDSHGNIVASTRYPDSRFVKKIKKHLNQARLIKN